MPTASKLREPEKQLGDFPETTAFERYAKRKSQMHSSAGLPRTDRSTPRTLEAQKVAIEGVYRLPHAIY